MVPGAIAWPGPETPLTPESLAAAIHDFAVREDVRAVALDGPHAWRNPHTPADLPGSGRRCEYLCRTQGKTGVYPKTYPGTQFAWIDFWVRVFDPLLAQPGVRLAEAPAEGTDAARAAHPHFAPSAPAVSESREARESWAAQTPSATPPRPATRDGYVVLECFPTSIWRASTLTPLPAKTKRPDVQRCYDALAAAYALPPVRVGNHDDLQAVVAALAGVSAIGGPVQARPNGDACWMADHADGPRRVEGVIWDAVLLA